jgi:hypothetical protein
MAWRENAVLGRVGVQEFLDLPAYTVATLPTTLPSGAIVFCSNGNAGQECLVRFDGTNWVSLASGATAAAA